MQKILHPLTGRREAAAQTVGRLLQLPLKSDARQGMVAAEIPWAHAHQQAAVDVLAAAGILAHAVGNGTPGLRGRRHHLSPGTDTEGEHAPSVGQVAGELVAAHRQGRMPGIFLILHGIHAALQMLDAHPHGKGLGLHKKALTIEPFHRVPGAVAQR